MAFAVGGGSCALLLLFDLTLSRRYRMPITAAAWWALRLCFEGAQGVLAIALLKGAAVTIKGIDGPAAWIFVGMVAPRLLRNIRYGDPAAPGFSLDVQDILTRLADPLDRRIDSASAQAEAAANERLVARLQDNGVTPAHIADRVIAVILKRRALDTRTAEVAFIRRTVANAAMAEDRKLRVIVDKARDLNILKTVKGAARRARKARR